MIKRILMSIAAMVASIGGVAVFTLVTPAVAGATTPSPTSTTCAQTGSVVFKAPGLSSGGSLTSAASVTTKVAVTPTGTGCSGTAQKLTIVSATTPCPQTGGVPNSGDPQACFAQKNGVYEISTKPNYYDTDGGYASNGLSDLQAALQAHPIKTTIDSIGVTLNYGSASEVLPGGACGSTDAGFNLTGNVQVKTTVVGTYTDLVCIVGDTGPGTTNNFVTDITSSTATIATATLGGSSSLNVSMPNESCGVTGTVVFKAPGLSQGGSLTSAPSVTTKSSTTATGSGCSGTPVGINIASATTPCQFTGGQPNSGQPAACSEQKNGAYVALSGKPNYYDTDGSFASSGTSDLQAALQAKPPKTTADGIKVTLAYGSAAEVVGGACGSDVGFNISGNLEFGTAPIGTYTDLVCIVGDTGPGTTDNFVNDLGSSTATIATAIIGGNSLLTMTLNP